jgi:fumarylacetoacetase
MLEFTTAGAKPVMLANGEKRGFLEDGDEISFRGRCSREPSASAHVPTGSRQ